MRSRQPLSTAIGRHLLSTFIVLSASCDRAEQGTGRHSDLRCDQDGLCWRAVGQRSLEGGFRRGKEEVRFDAIYSPSRSVKTQFRNEWSVRVLDQLGHPFFMAASHRPPPGWLATEVTYKGLDDFAGQTPWQMDKRDRLILQMMLAIERARKPEGRMAEPWEQIRRTLPLIFGSQGPSFVSAELERDVKQNHASSFKQVRARIAEDLSPRKDMLVGSDEGLTGESLLDDMSAHEDHADGVDGFDVEGEPDGESANEQWQLYNGLLQRGEKKPRAMHAEYINAPKMEFQQEIDLYWKHTRSFLAFGWKTGKHHTAACIRVKQRPRDSQQAWKIIRSDCTQNHGSKASAPDMKLYAECRDFPITKGYAVWGGECEGRYPSHFCNDDTALQIRHAYGEWDGGRSCPKRKRTHRPRCEKPW